MKTVYQQIINGNAEGVGNIDQSGNAGVFCAFFNFGQKFTTAIDFRGYNYDQIAMILTQKKRSTLRGRQEWNGVMVANIMKNERRWGALEARKSIVVDYKLGKVTKNNGNRCSAYVPEHHEAIVSPEIARAAHLVASSNKKCGVQDIVVIRQGALKGFVGIHPNWNGINAESIRSLCLNAYLPEEVMKLNDIAEMSFKVPENLLMDNRCNMRICSQQFINRLVEANNFSPLEFHRVEGKYLSGLNAVVFPIKVM